MQQWFNPSHPQTLQAAVFLGYLAGFFTLLAPGSVLFLLLGVGLFAGAFGCANNKKWGYYLLAISAVLRALMFVWAPSGLTLLALLDEVRLSTTFFIALLRLMNSAVFPVALAAAVLHPHSREYQKIWFE